MTNNNIKWAVEILENGMSGFDKEEKINYLEDVTQRGCTTGCVSEVIYTNDINDIFKDNTDDILERLTDISEEYDYDAVQTAMSRLGYDKDYTMFPTAAVWLIIENTAGMLLADLENEEDEEEEEE
ncbi:hypothetical protein Goe20_02610 [Bacillus phage vB_BsuM-Goe20]|nr:hypothetical protein Goe17_00130 [Bacillus phage vB_BsuM-Goe17]WCS69120.1 hypothetical protein Goe17_02610 [Bacillus phage vB_BsuM-Goe17]WCS69134.1 hypothetical protein Goe20_00120 [Bacillus phage vB_BsuM-Goe20]WCS69378.1 hypothetical protein Goe20_02610 [Bacillus phage vB_BsuM-Goe20]